MPKKKQGYFDMLLGSYVVITTNINYSQITESGEEYAAVEQKPLRYQAYIMDHDDEYIYVGNMEQVSAVIRKDAAKIIEIAELHDPIEDLLDSIPTPNDTENFN